MHQLPSGSEPDRSIHQVNELGSSLRRDVNALKEQFEEIVRSLELVAQEIGKIKRILDL